ncbi:MerR family transcriptional regulator [Oceanicella actignis]|uniref:DNA-binding transcriptional regulator, MerR family n=1 Tax=Oceanicella actignis TaxID=1189325 RepID=A0A1M7SVC5_9RHOB|nr:MerR family DNA-binding transcriptional regulator [Oceanicella actignis]TYO90631.1 DNA-binding transcriptional MerR regulator [Oceanicella actignis]SES72217.1 DNA-binding transcriptional regulator, MerR family [Oceanicella actignis]SHN62368.1 DNA-binding transcriptional regulator, MerR family [Oceanicella actignis]
MTEKYSTISEMCAEFGVTPRTLRFYEYKELLKPLRDGQKRLFTHRDRARLKLILRGKRFGFSLDEIRQWLELYDVDELTQMTVWIESANRQIGKLEAQKTELEEAIQELRDLMEVARQEIARRARADAAE